LPIRSLQRLRRRRAAAQARQVPSAHSLAVLAFEEAGKAWMCVIAMMVPDDVRPEWPYGDLMNKHVDKLMAAHVMAHVLVFASSGQDMVTSLADIGENLEELRASITRRSGAACTPTFSAALSGTRHWSPSTKPGACSPSSVACWITWLPGRSRVHSVAR
jgi:hypothetical protein